MDNNGLTELPFTSTSISKLEHDGTDFYVTFAGNGRRYKYVGCPMEVALEVSEDPSAGAALNRLVKPFYRAVEV